MDVWPARGTRLNGRPLLDGEGAIRLIGDPGEDDPGLREHLRALDCLRCTQRDNRLVAVEHPGGACRGAVVLGEDPGRTRLGRAPGRPLERLESGVGIGAGEHEPGRLH